MSVETIRIDQTKCNQCGLCARECVSGVIQLVNGMAQVVKPAWCNRCSHCAAVCPAGAVINEGLIGELARPLVKDRLDPAAYREIVMTRRSARWYRPEPVPRAELEELLDLARYSPTASNTMDVEYIVITDRDLIRATGRQIFRLAERFQGMLEKPWGRALFAIVKAVTRKPDLGRYLERLGLYREMTRNGRDLILHHAPVLILIHGPKGQTFARENCAIAATNLQNYAYARGLGACYIGFLVMALDRSRKLRERLGVPKGRRVGLTMTLGKPVHHYRNTAIRPPARVKWIGDA